MGHIASKKLHDKVVEWNRDAASSAQGEQINKTNYRAMNILTSFVKDRSLSCVERRLLDDSTEFMRAVLYSMSLIREFGLSFDTRNFIEYVNKFLEENDILEKYKLNHSSLAAIDTRYHYVLVAK